MTVWKTPKLKKLIQALLTLKTENELLSFLRDLCTVDELQELSIRWEIVQMLENNLSYREIAKKTGVSTTTITRIAYWLENGENGYKTALTKIKNKR